MMMISSPVVHNDGTPIPNDIKFDKLNSVSIAMLKTYFPLTTKKGVSLLAPRIADISTDVKYVWAAPHVSHPELSIQNDELTIRPDFHQLFTDFICTAPRLLRPTIPAGF